MTRAVSPLFGNSQRQPPANIQAEQSLLGAILINNRALDAVDDVLEPDHFADPVHGRIFEAMRVRVRAGGVADALSLKAQFEHSELLVDRGGFAYLAGLMTAMVSPMIAREYARRIRDLWVLRETISACTDAVERCFVPTDDGSAPIMEALEQSLLRISAGAGEAAPTVSMGEAVRLAVAASEAAWKRGDGLAGITWGYRGLDAVTAGLMPGEIYLIGARPAMGKTALGVGIGIRSAAAGNSVLYWSGEMGAAQIGTRAAAAHSGIGTASVFRGRGWLPSKDEGDEEGWRDLTQAEWDRLAAAELAAQRLPLELDTRPGITVGQLRARARRLKRSKRGLDLIIVDYVGLMQASADARRQNKNQEVTEISAGLKALAVELQVPMVILSQLSRDNEKREDKRPQLSDLRDSGALEQDASVVMFIHREHYYLKKSPPVRLPKDSDDQFATRCANWEIAVERSEGRAEILVAKNRHGADGRAELLFQNACTWFRDKREHPNAPAWFVPPQQEETLP